MPIVIRTVAKWLFAFAISLLLIWAITAVGTENIHPKVWAEQLQRNVPAPGWNSNNRSEAWATTTFGELGLRGASSVAAPSIPKIFVWGDSFVEAAQVPDSQKMHSQLNDLLDNDGNRKIQVIPLGRAFQSFPDYLFQIPLYEKTITPCALHVIHLHSLEDTLPDRGLDTRISLFLSKPDLHFVKYDNEFREVESPIYENRMKSLAYRLRLQFFLRTKKQISQITHLEGLRFSLGEQNLAAKPASSTTNLWDRYINPDWVSEEPPIKAWEFLVESLTNTTTLPILIVYAPVTPTLHKGKSINVNPEQKLASEFGEICEARGLGFVNMEESFLEYHRETGKYPRGFQSSRPWMGHYNTEGHRLVAEAIYRWIKENHDAVYPN